MARGGYFIGVGAQPVEQFAAAITAAGGDIGELKDVHARISKIAEADVRRNTPVGSASSKDSGTHKPPGYLRSTVKGGANAHRSWVRAGNKNTGYLILQEFGGSSYWHRGGKGALRALNTGNRAVVDLGGGQIGWSHEYSMRGRRSARGLSTSVSTAGHIIYRKARKPRGYFIWNVAYHLRQEIGEEYCRGMKQVAEDHELVFDIAISPAINIKPDSWSG